MEAGSPIGKGLPAVVSAVAFIEGHLGDELTLGLLASEVDYSKYHLHRLFAQAVGTTMHDYLIRRRLTEAARLLTHSGSPIVDVALHVGYESQQAFASAFKAFYKKTPNEYRREGFFYPLQTRYRPIGTAASRRGFVSPCPETDRASLADVPEWMGLVEATIDGFPRLDRAEYESSLRRGIGEGRAILMRECGQAIGAMIFRPETGRIDFLAVHPQFRGLGAEWAFIEWIAANSAASAEISLTTYREGDRADTGHRETVKRLGFTESELLVEFGYPTQRFAMSLESIKSWRS